MQGRVSVVIPTFNCAAFLPRAIDSALTQDYPDLEVIVVDDGSTDATPEVMERYAGRIVAIHQDNRGASAARNAGVRAATGEFVAFLDADDEYLPGRIGRCVRPMIDDPTIGMTHCLAWCKGSDGCRWTYGDVEQHRLFGSPLFPPTTQATACTTCRRELLTAVGGFDERLIAYEDHDLWLRMMEVAEVRHVPEHLAVVHVRPGSMTTRTAMAHAYDALEQVLAAGFVRHPERYRSGRRIAAARLHFLRAGLAYAEGDFSAARRHFWGSLIRAPRRRTLLYFLRACFPRRRCAAEQAGS